MDGNGAPAWMDQLPDDLKGNEGLTQFENIGDLGTKYLELEGSQAGAIRIPGEGANDEEWDAHFKALGRPEDPSGYELALPEEFPEALGPNEKESKEYREALYKFGISGTQAQGLFQFAMAKAKENWGTLAEQRKKYRNDAIATLKQEWGDEYDTNLTRANKLIDKFATPGLTSWLKESQLGNWPEFARFAAAVAQEFDDDAFLSGDPAGGRAGDKRPLGVDGKPRFSYDLKK